MDETGLQLSEETVARFKQCAEARGVTPDQLLRALIENIEPVLKGQDPFLGMFADDADLLDQIVEEVMEARRRVPFRSPPESDG